MDKALGWLTAATKPTDAMQQAYKTTFGKDAGQRNANVREESSETSPLVLPVA